ncbi:MAG: MATE family efflux transporter [Deltaproteobacteria bacterium]|nr:MATE family efflux transporter [Deltaproteobacteria bacterium]
MSPHYLKELTKLALPLSIIQVGQMAMGLVDTAFLGRVSATHLAASGIGNSIFFGIIIFGMGVCLGSETLVSQAAGKEDHPAARLHFHQGLVVAFFVSFPLLAALWAALYGVRFIGLDDEVVRLTQAYVMGRLPGIFGFLFFIVQRNYVQSYNLTKPAWIAMVVANVVNIVADSVLIFGDESLVFVGLPGLGLPAYGVAGAGVGTSICAWVQVLVLVPAVVAIAKDKGLVRISLKKAWHAVWHQLGVRQIVRVGIPVGLQYGLEVGIFASIALLMGRLSTEDAAANQIALNIASTSFSFVLGVSIATSILVGQQVGKGNPDAIYGFGLVGIASGGVLMGASGLVLFFFPEALVLIFTDGSNEEVVRKAVVLLRIAAAFQLGDGVQAVAGGALRGAGDTDAAFIGNFVAYWVIGMPIALALTYGLGWGAPGLWWGLTAGLFAAGIALSTRFLRKARSYHAVMD